MSSSQREEFHLGRWALDEDFASEYLRVVEDGSPVYGELGVVPPMALAARAMGALVDALSLPPGTIHAAQELHCRRLVRLGEEVSCVATLSRPVRRGDWRFIVAEFSLRAASGETVLSGKSTVLVPEDVAVKS